MPFYVSNRIFSYLEFQHAMFCMFNELIVLVEPRYVLFVLHFLWGAATVHVHLAYLEKILRTDPAAAETSLLYTETRRVSVKRG